MLGWKMFFHFWHPVEFVAAAVLAVTYSAADTVSFAIVILSSAESAAAERAAIMLIVIVVLENQWCYDQISSKIQLFIWHRRDQRRVLLSKS
jgi:hypothetical protein